VGFGFRVAVGNRVHDWDGQWWGNHILRLTWRANLTYVLR
jgi:hypothetical protein